MLSPGIRAEVDRLLLQWYRAQTEVGGGGGSHPMWAQVGRNTVRAGNVIPLLQAESWRTDEALRAMPDYLLALLLEAKLDVEPSLRRCAHRTRDAKARARNMSRKTYYRWLCRAEGDFWHRYGLTREVPACG